MKNYDILCFGLRIQDGETVQLIIYVMVLFLKTGNVFFFKEYRFVSSCPGARLFFWQA